MPTGKKGTKKTTVRKPSRESKKDLSDALRNGKTKEIKELGGIGMSLIPRRAKSTKKKT